MKYKVPTRSLAIAAYALLLAACGADREQALQGYAEGEFVRIAAPIAGQLARLNVARGTAVKTGDALFTLEQENEAAARREAQDRVTRAQAQLANLQKGKRPEEIDTARAQLAQAEVNLKLSETNLARQEQLVRSNFISKGSADEARTNRDRDRERIKELQAQLATAKLAARPDEIRAAAADLEAARASLEQAQWRLEQKSVRTPQDGMVTDTIYVQGEWVPAGSPVISLLPPTNIKVRFFVSEKDLSTVRLGQAVSISCDGCKGTIAAPVSFIAPQAEYTPPVIYSKENRAKLVFLIEARPAPDAAVLLHPGQPVEVKLQK